ncbi:hypothetical protein [Bradyrhizobium sp. LTSPM299]|uniref:hypothetical protein n=1 Tax=Bradyrhizobium sp. LTSPM299 TaxID=1619233 RepID=UPI000B04DA10|nr:hypothetical protein [Bradyrhizobium sp. LTSPM299]
MAMTDRTQIVRGDARDHDALIVAGYLIASTIFMLALYWAATSPGTASGDIASMIVFP